MAVSPFKVFAGGEILTASDLNSSFSQVFDNGEDLGWPATKAKDFDGQELILDGDGDTSITADTDDQIDIKIGGTDRVKMTNTSMELSAGVKFGYDAEQAWEVRTAAGATLVAGDKIMANTNGGAFTLTFPVAATAGDTIWVADYDGSHGSNACIIDENGLKIAGDASVFTMNSNNNAFRFVYIDATQGWRPL